MGTAPAPWIILTAVFLWMAVPVESKVYYVCGAVLDSTEKGLILSPGFPNNYLSGFHCVWQFFIPTGSRLVIETLDFDVYGNASDDGLPLLASSGFTTLTTDTKASNDAVYTEASVVDISESAIHLKTTVHAAFPNEINKEIVIPKERWDRTDQGEKPVRAFQSLTAEKANLNEGAGTLQKGDILTSSKSDGSLGKESNKLLDIPNPFTGKMTEHFEGYWQEQNKGATSSSIVLGDGSDQTTSPPLVDVCPHDVLYISDLITFSTQFCGSNTPLNKVLVFGSNVEMVEVIMELITTTDRGRGFAVLFSYQNQTSVTAMGVMERQSKEDIILLAVTSATISFALVLLLVLCLSYRQKMCPKRDHSIEQVTPHLSGAQNAALDVSELQQVVPGEDLIREQEPDSREEKAADLSKQTLQEDPSSSIATVTSDDVFVISDRNNRENFSFTNYPKQCILKRSVTSPASVSDWLNWDYTSVELGTDDTGSESMEADPARQRTWSIRTFNSLLPPMPQLQVKWSNRLSSGSFTKLVDSGSAVPPKILSPRNHRRACSAVQIKGSSSPLYSESSDSNASYPLTRSAQLTRKLPPCNLKRTRPYFGFLNGSSDSPRSSAVRTSSSRENQMCQNSGMEFAGTAKSAMSNILRAKELSVDVEKPKAVFVICEEADDQQPLVLDDQLSPSREMFCVNEIGSSSCKEEVQPVGLRSNHSDLNPWVKTPEDYQYPYTKKMPLYSLDENQSNLCVARNSRHDSELDGKSLLAQMGLPTD
ncbi:uncharacterized protein LOC134610973 isoform X1 [Pelobates fuscus]|uniref:uncharacterized protein LOC134610973 isoform X1 n=1 Tax=Pelobates fuscus TaxID=191477 RepID=UPI002FE4552B